MTPDVTYLHSLHATRAVRQSGPAATPRALRPVDSYQPSAEAREGAAGLAPGFLAALGQSLKPTAQLPSGAHAHIRSNVEKALRLRHLSESERLSWLQSQVRSGGPMDYKQAYEEGSAERAMAQRLCERNCGAVGAALALRQDAILSLASAQLKASDKNQVLDGIREGHRYLNGEPSQLGQRGRQQYAPQARQAGQDLANRVSGDPAGAFQAIQAFPGPERLAVALALAQRLQSRDFREIPHSQEGNRFLEQLRQQLVNGYVGQTDPSPEAAMLSQQLAVTRARRLGSLPC